MALNEGDLFIHLHIPKTAGTTMRSIIRSHFDTEHSEEIYPHWGKADFHRQIRRLSGERKKRLRCLQGHFVYGVHKHFDKKPVYVAMVRDPVERAISLYHFILLNPQHHMHRELKEGGLTLENYHEWRSTRMAAAYNAQTRYLAGVVDREPTERDLAEAKRNVERYFALVGLTEQFDETVFLMNSAFGWNTRVYGRLNITAKRPKRNELSEETLKNIQNANWMDMELYSFVKDLFEKRLQSLSPVEKEKLGQFLDFRARLDPDENLRHVGVSFGEWVLDEKPSSFRIFGAGQAGKSLLYTLKKWNNSFGLNVRVLHFWDNDSSKWGQEIEGIPVMKPDVAALPDDDSYIVIASMYHEAIKRQLLDAGADPNRIKISVP